jgi:hypothetical protein
MTIDTNQNNGGHIDRPSTALRGTAAAPGVANRPLAEIARGEDEPVLFASVARVVRVCPARSAAGGRVVGYAA